MAKSTNGRNGVDAIAMLKADHRAVEELFAKYEGAKSSAVKAKLAQQVCKELLLHTTIEEEIFYPGVKEAIDEEIYTEAYVEHDGAKTLIAEILAGSPVEDFFDAKVKVLSEMIKHHVKEEEQRDGMFAQAKSGDVDLKELGAQMQARKEELKSELVGELPPPETHVLKGAAIVRGQPPAI